jgi:hypothetical protein
MVAEAFLDCTAYRVSDNKDVREGEQLLLTSLLLYLYSEAPINEEMSMIMLCLLVQADIPNDYSTETDLQRLFAMLSASEKGNRHDALKLFNAYLENPVRAKVVKSLGQRLSPLYSFQPDEGENIFRHCSSDEVGALAIALLHNCADCPEKIDSLKNKATEIAFLSSALFFIYEICDSSEQTAKVFFKLLQEPQLLESLIKQHPQAENAAKYWSSCRKKVLRGKYDKVRVDGIEKFYMEFG